MFGDDLDVARLGVRQRAVLGRGHDRIEARAARAAAAHLLLQRERHLALGPADQAALAHPVVDLVGEHRGGADLLHLAGLLERALGLHRAAGGDELDALGQQLAQPLVLAHAQVLVLEAEPHRALRPAGLERLGELLRRALAVEVADLRLGALDVAEVGDEAPRLRPQHHHRARAGEAGEVADVDEVGDQQQVGAALGEPAGDPVRAAHSASLSFSSAVR